MSAEKRIAVPLAREDIAPASAAAAAAAGVQRPGGPADSRRVRKSKPQLPAAASADGSGGSDELIGHGSSALSQQQQQQKQQKQPKQPKPPKPPKQPAQTAAASASASAATAPAKLAQAETQPTAHDAEESQGAKKRRKKAAAAQANADANPSSLPPRPVQPSASAAVAPAAPTRPPRAAAPAAPAAASAAVAVAAAPKPSRVIVGGAAAAGSQPSKQEKKAAKKVQAAAAALLQQQTQQNKYDQARAGQLRKLFDTSKQLLASQTDALAAATDMITNRICSIPKAALSALERCAADVVTSMLLAQLDVQSLLQVGRCSQTLWSLVALKAETWRCVIPPPFIMEAAGSHVAGASSFHRSDNIKSPRRVSPPGVWSLVARHSFVLRWPPSNSQNQEAITELGHILRAVPLPPLIDANGQRSSLLHGFTLDLSSVASATSYIPFHGLCSVQDMLPQLLSCPLIAGVSELYMDGLLGPISRESWHPLTPQSMQLLTDLPLLHTLSVMDRATAPTLTTSLLQHLGQMRALTALAFTGHVHRGSAHVAHIAACKTLRTLHLHFLPRSYGVAVTECSLWTLDLPTHLEQIAVDFVLEQSFNAYNSRPGMQTPLDFITRDQPDSSKRESGSSSACAAAAAATPAAGAGFSPPSTLTVLHLLDFSWPTPADSRSLVSAVSHLLNLSELHVHVRQQSSGRYGYGLMGMEEPLSVRRTSQPLHDAAVCLGQLLEQIAPHIHVHVYFDNNWSNSQAATLSCFPGEAEEAALQVAAAPSSRGRLHVWDAAMPGGSRAILRNTAQVSGPSAWPRRLMQQRRSRYILAMSTADPEEYARYQQMLQRREAEREREQLRQVYEDHHQSLVAAVNAEDGVAPAAGADLMTLHLELLLSAEVRASGVASRMQLRLSGDVLLSRLHRLASDLSDLPAASFALRAEERAPFSPEDLDAPISSLHFNDLLRQVLKKGHLHERFDAALQVEQRQNRWAEAASMYGMQGVGPWQAPAGFLSLGSGGFAPSADPSYLYSSRAVPFFAPSAAAAASATKSRHPKIDEMLELIRPSRFNYLEFTRFLDSLMQDVHAEIISALVQHVLQHRGQAAERTSVLLQCICSDGFISAESILLGLRGLRTSTNNLQREARHRTLMANDVVQNFHPFLNELIEQLLFAHSTVFGWTEEQFAELLCSEEDVVLPANHRKQLASTGSGKEGKLRAQQKKWAAYDEMAKAVAQSTSSANAILHLDNALPFGFTESTAAGAPMSLLSSAPLADAQQALITVFSSKVGGMPLASVRLLHGILDKLLRAADSADGDKFRKIKLAVPKVQQYLVQVDGAVQLLEAAGFQQQTVTRTAEEGAAASASFAAAAATASPESPPVTATPQFLIFPREASLDLVTMAHQLLSPVLLAATAAAAATEAAAVAAATAATAAAVASTSVPAAGTS